MIKYYTRACNFYYGSLSKKLIKKGLTLPLCGDQFISFDKIELLKRSNNKVHSKIVNIKDIKKLNSRLKKKINFDLKKIVCKRKIYTNPSIMGILNMTPDSFSDGGKYNSSYKAFKHISSMIKDGANIIDVGGESTRPGAKTLREKDEWNRIKKIIKVFKKKFPNTLLSVDTRKSLIMKKCLKFKTDIINDVSGFKHDKNSIKIINKNNIWKVIHHMQGEPSNMQKNPKYKNVLLDIYDFFENTINKKIKNKNKIILDPGIGFGKNLKHNLIILSNISLFHSLGFPILIGTSRKRFINQISGSYDTKDRLGGSLSSVLYLLTQGVQVFRVHNVKEIKQGILVFKKILEQ